MLLRRSFGGSDREVARGAFGEGAGSILSSLAMEGLYCKGWRVLIETGGGIALQHFLAGGGITLQKVAA